MNPLMAAVRPLPGVPQFQQRDRFKDSSQDFVVGHGFEADWAASNFQAMALHGGTNNSMPISVETATYSYADMPHCMKPLERRSSINAPVPWGVQWHGSNSSLPYDLKIPPHGPLGGRWTPIDQDTVCSGGSTWSPRTSDSRSDADGCAKYQLAHDKDVQGLSTGYPAFGEPLLFPEDLPHTGPGCSSVISPLQLQQNPDPEAFFDEPGMRSELHEIAPEESYSPEETGPCSPYVKIDRVGPEDEALGSSIQDDSRAPSIQNDDDSAMGESPEVDDDDEYSPKLEKRGHGPRLSQRSSTFKKSSSNPKRLQRTKNPTNQAAKPTKIAKKAPRSSGSPPTGSRNANTTPCHYCSDAFPSESTLKKHILASHTRPFICTFHDYGCPSIVGSKNEWKRHINVQHMHLETWRCDLGACASQPRTQSSQEHKQTPSLPSGTSDSHTTPSPAPYHDFDRKDLFTQHLKRMHSPAHSASKAEKTRFEASIETIQRRCHRKLRDPPSNAICPYCPHLSPFESWDDRVEHVGKHLEKGDFDKSKEVEDVVVREWLVREGYLVSKSGMGGWRLRDVGKKRKVRGEKAMVSEEGDEDAEGEDE